VFLYPVRGWTAFDWKLVLFYKYLNSYQTMCTFTYIFDYCMGARRHGQEGALASPMKMLQSVLCISSYSKTPSGRIIYALFSQPVVCFWGLCPLQTPSLGDFRLQTPNLPIPGKKSCGRPWITVMWFQLVTIWCWSDTFIW